MQQAYWNGEFFIANINLVSDQGRNGRDANTVLGPIAVFDVNAQCDDPSIQPCNSRGLSNFKSFVDHFRNGTLYPINEGLPEGSGIALGRYTEDVYYDGNPWYLINAGAAEYLYGAVAQWEKQGRLTVDETSLDFFAEIYPDAAVRTYSASNSTEFPLIVDAVWTYADTFVEVLRQYTPANGSLSEQFNKTSPFNPTSARDLTWSYAAFITMAERRAGEFPPSWVSATSQPDIPSTCSAGSTTGVYEPATAAGAPDVNVTCTSTVRFQVEGETYFGESIYVTGNTTDLGGWTLENAWPLSASSYPVWAAEIPLVPGEHVSYGFVREQDCGQPPIWETLTTGNRTIVVPDCDPDADPGEVLLTTDDTWTGEEGTSGGC